MIEPVPEEPVGVVVAGPDGEARRTLLSALLGGTPLPSAAGGGLLVIRPGPRPTGGLAHIPGYRQPHPLSDPAGPPLPRPPRRVELALPDPLLRHTLLADTPETGALGLAGTRVVTDAARRAGAMLFVLTAGRPAVPADFDLLAAAVRAGVTVFLAVVPGPQGWPPPRRTTRSRADTRPAAVRAEVSGPAGADPGDPASTAIRLHRDAVIRAVPALNGVGWFAVDPFAADTAYLRRALVEWADREGLRRAGDNLPIADGATRTVRVARNVADSDWADRLDRQVRLRAHRLRQHLALELANIHLRCVQQIIFGSGCAGLPTELDREVEALSLLAMTESDAAVSSILDETFSRVFGATPDEGVRRRVVTAVRRGLADHAGARALDRVLLVTSTGGVATVIGLPAVAALAGYPGQPGRATLPPLGIALSEGCYQLWRNRGRADTSMARSWLQRALREVEVELSREVLRRFEALRLSFAGVLSDAIDHGILLA